MREVLGTQPFLWVLSPVIALGCVTEVQRTQSIQFDNISMNVSFPAGLPFLLLGHSSAEIGSCLIIACLKAAGPWGCAEVGAGRQAATARPAKQRLRGRKGTPFPL